ncbi:MAG: hypothetical protein LBT67_00575 [Holosporaceae bacterium]|jgi:hypothetical protein|nr:hypothetical protein [Holosporaceae bacterium]
MYAFFGEKNLRLFDGKWRDDAWRPDFIPDDLDQRQVILDRAEVDFSLETLRHCNFLDARDALRCERKVSGDFDDVFLLPKHSFNIFQKTDFHMQKSTICGDLGKKLKSAGEIFLVEFLIAEFCKTIQQIDEETWWMYVANHRCSGLRIVAGRGDGVVLSRIISGASLVSLDGVSDSVARSIKYLGRFGMQSPIKIISAFGNVVAADGLSMVSIIENGDDMEKTLLKFLATRNDIYPYGRRESGLRKIMRLNYKKICALLAFCLIFETVWLVNLERKCADERYSIKAMEKFSENTVEHDLSHIKFRINSNNFKQMEQLFHILKAAENPLIALRKTAMLVEKNAIKVDRLIMEKCNSIRMNAVVTKSLENKLLRLCDEATSIHIEKTASKNSDYEKIDADDSANEKYGVVICVGTK